MAVKTTIHPPTAQDGQNISLENTKCAKFIFWNITNTF